MPLPREETLSLFFAGEIEIELQRFIDGIDMPPNSKHDLSELEWSNFMYEITTRLGTAAPESDSVRQLMRDVDYRLVQTLHARLSSAIQRMNEIVNYEFEAQGGRRDIVCLLPTTFPARFGVLIGEGRLQLAKVEQYDLLQ